MVPDKQILLDTNALTTITGITNLNDFIVWVDANLAGKTGNWNTAYQWVTTNTVYADATNAAYTMWTGRVVQLESNTNNWNLAYSNSLISTVRIAAIEARTNDWNTAATYTVTSGITTNIDMNAYTGTVQYFRGYLTNAIP
jgi:hypothetical protein